MAFVDELDIEARAGRGGNGVVRWLHIKGKEKGGPAGGDGGKGGDIVLEGVSDLAVLASYRYSKRFVAENGSAGENNNRHGKDGEDIVLRVPVGTYALVKETGASYDIVHIGERVTVFKGGAGGFGNAHFKSSVNQNPEECTRGKTGQGGDIHLSLKLIANAGLIGLPNAGKSSLLNALTRARSKVGAYPFTTLDPYLGDFYGRLLADIPGLIEGASSGRGLGAKFLKHVERTGMLVHLVSSEQEDVVASYRGVRKELETFGQGLSDKQELVVLSKTDLLSVEEQGKKLKELMAGVGEREVITVSIVDDASLKSFSDRLASLLPDTRSS